MIDNSDAWKKRAKEVLEFGIGGHGRGSESAQFATSMLTALYGPQSQQLKQHQLGVAGIEKKAHNSQALNFQVHQHACGVIRNTLAELEAGLILQLRIAVEGEILSELIRVARELRLTKRKRRKMSTQS